MKPLKLAEFSPQGTEKTVGGGGSGESRKSAEGARSVTRVESLRQKDRVLSSPTYRNDSIVILFGATEGVSVVFLFSF